MMATVALLIDAPAGRANRDLTEAALAHSAAAAGIDVVVEGLHTATLGALDMADFDGVLVGPGSPYEDPAAVIDWIRTARERGVPLVGT
jgi:CTP synthase (UTP-ammonia lyase)